MCQMLETKLLCLCGETRLCGFRAGDGDKDGVGKTMRGNRISQNEVGRGLMRLALPLCPYQSQTPEPACVYV